MKKLVTLLLALLILASCFVFASCDEEPKCIDGGPHIYRNIYDEPSAYCQKCGEQKDYSDRPSIGETIVFGIVCLVVALIMHWIGLYNQSAFFIRAPLFAFIILTAGCFFAYGVGRGIIMAVFFVLYVAGSIRLNRKHLGYNDYI